MREAILTSLTLAIFAADLSAAETPEPVSNDTMPRQDASISRSLSAPCVDGDPEPDAVRDLNRDLRAFLHRWREDEELLGDRRRRDLQTARFHIARDRAGRDNAMFDLAEDDPLAYEETLDILRSCVGKLAREHLEQRLYFDELEDRFSAGRRLEGDDVPRRGWRISPRLGLSRDPYLGANFQLRRSPDDFWSHFTLGVRQRLESGEGSVFLQYEDRGGDRFVRLEQVFGDQDVGDRLLLSVRMHF